ncbi:hypothetical protein GT347_20130 [Xylophilus rhododendri]|uniref:Uncharacterized protein n=1 Tax=Xylophilus rhododendri TaxID=2697032 RepID=A0A857JA41_9BURK|nr:hypothetical protein [Xylophilus rhododendri]QHJ00084.1 hypothetical protein GT347_20130 [Xylophilus rhododendri]
MNTEAFIARREVLHLMVTEGGAFAHHIAKAWLTADPANSARLAAAFGDLYAYYAAQLPAEVRP